MVCECENRVHFFRVFLVSENRICFARNEILQEGKSAIWIWNSLDFQIGASGKKSIDKKRNVYYRIDNKHPGIVRDA